MQARALPLRRQCGRGDPGFRIGRIDYSEQPMRRQFRFASEGQSRSSRLLAELSPVCKHELCRSASNVTVMSLAAGSDEWG